MSTIVGVLSILEGALPKEAERLWQVFDRQYGSIVVRSFDYPHLTFQGGQCDDVVSLRHDLSCLCRKLTPFTVVVDGWDCFRPANVVFLDVVPTDQLLRVHQAISELLRRHSGQLLPRYLPARWHPHITVAMGDLSDEMLARALSDLSEYHPKYQQEFSTLSLVQRVHEAQHVDLVASFELSGPQGGAAVC